MLEFNRVLIPVDFSEFSKHTLEACSTAFSGQKTKDFHFVYVWSAPSDGTWQGDPKGELEGMLDDFVGSFKHEGEHTKTTAVLMGHPADEITTYAKKHDCDIIVLASHGRTGLRHLLIGSCAEKVVRHAPCAVLTLHVALTHPSSSTLQPRP